MQDDSGGAPRAVGALSELRLRLLGPFEVEGVDRHRLGTRRARTLLKVLALARGRSVSVDRLVECLWPDDPPARPGVQVGVLVSRLRGVLGADRLVRTEAGYALVFDWVDVDALAELAGEAARRLGAGSYTLARVAASAAVALDRGPLLADEPEAEWAALDRAAGGRLVSQVRHTAAQAALAVGDVVAAAELAEGLVDHDPYDEVALRILMAAHATAGRPASALAAYAKVRARLAEDLGVDPAPATEAVHTAILRQQPISGLVVRTPVPVGPSTGKTRESGFAGAIVPGSTPGPGAVLPGREAELAALDAALERVAAGSLEIVVVEGEAGIGKTRLLSAWSARAKAAGVTVLAGTCDELERALPLQAVGDALTQHLRAVGSEAAGRLLGSDAPLLAPLLGWRASGTPVPVATLADPAVGQALLFDAVLAVLERVAGGGPVVLILDDVHLAGASTVDWLRFSAHRGSGRRLLAVAARRPEEGVPLPVSATINLGPLDLVATEAVVGAERAAVLYTRSQGNPLFLVELAAADPADELPASIREAVAARCDRTGPAAATLRTAAVIGPEVDLDLLAAVLRVPAVQLLDHLEEGVRRGFLTESCPTFAFGHQLVREALAAGTGASRRALIHREAARLLGDRLAPDPLVVAYHARLGGDDTRAGTALAEAARLAADRYDYAEAERLLDQALALHDAAEARLLRARVRLMLPGRFAEVAEDARVAVGLGAGAPALEVTGWAAYYQRDFAAARRLAYDGARLATDPHLRASCLALAGAVRTAEGELRKAGTHLEEATGLAEGPGLVVASGWLATLRVHQGRAEEALELLAPAVLPGALAGPGFLVLRARMFEAYAQGLLGRPVEALAAADELDAEQERRHSDRYAGASDNFRGWVLRNLGALPEAAEANQRAMERVGRLTDQTRRTEIQLHSLFDLADGYLQVGDLDAARSHLDRTDPLRRSAHTLRWRYDLRAGLLRGRVALAEGHAEEAQATAISLAEDAERLGAPRYGALARLLEARARAALGEPVELAVVDGILASLSSLAGLEEWWLTAEVAKAANVDAWWTLAERRAARLAQAAGPYGDTLLRYAGTRLERMRTSSRNG